MTALEYSGMLTRINDTSILRNSDFDPSIKHLFSHGITGILKILVLHKYYYDKALTT